MTTKTCIPVKFWQQKLVLAVFTLADCLKLPFEITEFSDILCQAMKNKKESQEADKYGKIPPSEKLRLLIDIIGQNAILDLIPKENRLSYKVKLQRINEGKIPYHNVAIFQRCCEQYFNKIESKYEVSPLIGRSLISNLYALIGDFSLYTKRNIVLSMSKNKIALYLLQERAFHYINDDSKEKDAFSDLDMNIFKTSEEKVHEFLTDSYKRVFDEIMQKFKNKEAFYKEITGLGEEYKENINNWQNGKVYNPYWRTLVPVLDCLKKHIDITFVHRLIGLYLRKNAQKAFAGVLSISEGELEQIIKKIADMIEAKKRPKNFLSTIGFDEINFIEQRINITKYLEFQNNYENNKNVIKSDDILKYSNKHIPSSEEMFLKLWLQTRAKVFEKYNDLKNKKIQKEILEDYKEAFDELLKDIKGSPFLTQFLAEIILINIFFHPRREKDINDYLEYGCTLGVICADKSKGILNDLKESRNADIRKTLVNIHSKFHCRK